MRFIDYILKQSERHFYYYRGEFVVFGLPTQLDWFVYLPFAKPNTWESRPTNLTKDFLYDVKNEILPYYDLKWNLASDRLNQVRALKTSGELELETRKLFLKHAQEAYSEQGYKLNETFAFFMGYNKEVIPYVYEWVNKSIETLYDNYGKRKARKLVEAYTYEIVSILSVKENYFSQVNKLNPLFKQESADIAKLKLQQTKLLKQYAQWLVQLPALFDDLAHKHELKTAYDVGIVPADFTVLTETFLENWRHKKSQNIIPVNAHAQSTYAQV